MLKSLTFLGLLLFFQLFCCFKFFSYKSIIGNYSIKFFRQKVDHFNYVNNDTFKQRYVISFEHWDPESGVIFFVAGHESDIIEFVERLGFIWEQATHFKAMVVFAEHRYYGKSMPFGDKSYQGLAHLGYFTTEQALADYAFLIQYLKSCIPGAKHSPVIMFGGSYGGMLSAWFRVKYPHLIIGALASSAPIFQFPCIYRCNRYTEIVTNDYRDYSERCVQVIRKSWPALRRKAETKKGRRWLSDTFALCQQLGEADIDQFFRWLFYAWDSLSMYDYPNPFTADNGPVPAYPIGKVCDILKSPDQEDEALLQDIYKGVSVLYNYSGQTPCNSITEVESRGWNYQSCTEMVMPICSNGVTDMFEKMPWDLNKYSDDCFKKYNVRPDDKKVIWMFGGRDIQASNIIFSNGLRDPYSAGGVLKSRSKNLIAITIASACHAEDIGWSGPNDPDELRKARKKEVKIMKRWVEEYYNK